MRRLIKIALAAALLAAPAAAEAAVERRLPVGAADGVRLVQRGGQPKLLFTRRANMLWKQIAGRSVQVSCSRFEGIARVGASLGGSSQRVPRRGRTMGFGLLGLPAEADYCTVALHIESGRSLYIEPVVRIPVSQAGAVAFDEAERAEGPASVLSLGSELAAGTSPPRFLSVDELTRGEIGRMLRRDRVRIVGLAAPTDTPPAGRIGYWSDGGQHAATVILSATGRRLFLEMGPDGELRTNASRPIFEGSDL